MNARPDDLPVLSWTRVGPGRAQAVHGGVTFVIDQIEVGFPKLAPKVAPRVLFQLAVFPWFDGRHRYLEAKPDLKPVLANAREWAVKLPQPSAEVMI